MNDKFIALLKETLVRLEELKGQLDEGLCTVQEVDNKAVDEMLKMGEAFGKIVQS